MRIATVDECRRIDERSQSEYGLAGETLMEAAGAISARTILDGLKGRGPVALSKTARVKKGRIVIVCGPGNNGGDGLVVARHLVSAFALSAPTDPQARRWSVETVLLGPESKRSALFSLQLERCRQQGILIEDAEKDIGALARAFSSREAPAIVIDAVFGIGLRSEVSGNYLAALKDVNEARLRGAFIVSLDTPSGLDSDRGAILGEAVRAHVTLTFGIAKRGFFVSDGPECVGRLEIVPIGFPPELVDEIASTHVAIGARSARGFLPLRKKTSNKTTHGHTAIIAGQEGMWGAAILSATAAYRVGSGYVTLASRSDPREVVRERPEVLTARIDDGSFWEKRKWTSVGVGPGLGTGEETANVLRKLFELKIERVVVDADAITVLAREGLKTHPGWILTPHAGELSRLIHVPAREIEANRFHFAQSAAEKLGCHVVLKGFRTVVARPGATAVILSGNAALAKAGSGDVLTGLIAGLLAQGLLSFEAAGLGAYLHGKIADVWVAQGRGSSTLVASDLSERLFEVVGQLEGRKA